MQNTPTDQLARYIEEILEENKPKHEGHLDEDQEEGKDGQA